MRGKEESTRQGGKQNTRAGVTQVPIQTAGVSKKVQALKGAQQTKPGTVPGGEKGHRIGRENNLRRGRNQYLTLSEFWGKAVRKRKAEQEKNEGARNLIRRQPGP